MLTRAGAVHESEKVSSADLIPARRTARFRTCIERESFSGYRMASSQRWPNECVTCALGGRVDVFQGCTCFLSVVVHVRRRARNHRRIVCLRNPPLIDLANAEMSERRSAFGIFFPAPSFNSNPPPESHQFLWRHGSALSGHGLGARYERPAPRRMERGEGKRGGETQWSNLTFTGQILPVWKNSFLRRQAKSCKILRVVSRGFFRDTVNEF